MLGEEWGWSGGGFGVTKKVVLGSQSTRRPPGPPHFCRGGAFGNYSMISGAYLAPPGLGLKALPPAPGRPGAQAPGGPGAGGLGPYGGPLIIAGLQPQAQGRPPLSPRPRAWLECPFRAPKCPAEGPRLAPEPQPRPRGPERPRAIFFRP